jgi:hypothetical protein
MIKIYVYWRLILPFLIFQVNDFPTLLLYKANDKTNPVITQWHPDFGDIIFVYKITSLL